MPGGWVRSAHGGIVTWRFKVSDDGIENSMASRWNRLRLYINALLAANAIIERELSRYETHV